MVCLCLVYEKQVPHSQKMNAMEQQQNNRPDIKIDKQQVCVTPETKQNHFSLSLFSLFIHSFNSFSLFTQIMAK